MENIDPWNLLPEGLHLNTSGSGTTLRPAGWTLQSSVHPTGVTASLVSGDASIKGNWWKVTAVDAAGLDNTFYTVSGNYAAGHPLARTAKIIPGHTYAHVGRLKATGLRNANSGSGSGVLISAWFGASDVAKDCRAVNSYYDVSDGVFCHEFVAPAGENSVLVRRQLLNSTDGDGTLQIAQHGLYDLTAMGLA